jgi:PAS domain S-box-containing protein
MTARSVRELQLQLQQTRARLAEAEETLQALHRGDVDAVVVDGEFGPQVFTLKSAAEPYRMLVEQMREGALTVSARAVILYCNQAFAQVVGVEAERLVGTSVLDLIASDDLAALMATGGCSGRELLLRQVSGKQAAVMVSSVPMTGDEHPVTCLVVTDLTRQQLRARYEAIVEATVDGVYSLTPELAIETWNPGARLLYGYDAGEIIGRSERDLYPDGNGAALDDLVETVRQCGHAVTIDDSRCRKDGSIVQVIFCLAPLRDGDGRLTGYAAVAHDITERKHQEQTRQLLVGELNHRVKNTLAIVQAMASQTLQRSTGLADFLPNFTGRLRALSAAHNVLTNTAWRGASLASLVQDQLELGDSSIGRYQFSGPDVWLDPQSAIRLALVLHELGTNAHKHGALSVPEGRVSLTWRADRATASRTMVRQPVVRQPMVRLCWHELHGPRIGEPRQRGFGSLMIEQSLRPDGGGAELKFQPAGLLCRFRVPIRNGRPLGAG